MREFNAVVFVSSLS